MPWKSKLPGTFMILHLFFVTNVCLYLPVFVLPYKDKDMTTPVGLSEQESCPWPCCELPWLSDGGQHSWRHAVVLCRRGALRSCRVVVHKLHLMPAVKSPWSPLPQHELSPPAFTMMKFRILSGAAWAAGQHAQLPFPGGGWAELDAPAPLPPPPCPGLHFDVH